VPEDAKEAAPATAEPAAPVTPKKRSRARPKAESASETAKTEAPAPSPKPETPRVPRRATLSADDRTLLSVKQSLDARRPVFGRQAANRYYRIGRDGTWRRPRGLQSKQRRHYGYRARIVRIGYRTPARVRGLVPSGFRPVLVQTSRDLEGLDARTQAAVIGRTVGTRRRLVLEEEARKLGIRVLNPIVKSETEA
jgi:large subunit ribosomal protein L32e